MKEILRNRAIRMTLGGIAAIAGAGGIIHSSFVDYDFTTKSSPKIERRVEQLMPGYKPQEFLAAQKVVFDFNSQTNDLITRGAKTIDVPENVTQAVTFIKDGQELYDKNRKLYAEIEDNDRNKRGLMGVSSILATFVGGVLFLANLGSKPKEPITQRGKSNSSQTQS